MSFFSKTRLVGALVGVALTGALSAEAVAGPMSVTPGRGLTVGSSLTDVKYTPKKKRVVRHVRRGGNRAAGAVLGLFAAGVGAAIANSRRYDYYDGYPGYYYGGPAYYSGPRYYSAPRYYAPPAYSYGLVIR